jgi:hypothetical protein
MAAGGGVVASGFFFNSRVIARTPGKKMVFGFVRENSNFQDLLCSLDGEFIVLKSLQKANISDRIDEFCKSKEKTIPTHDMT